MAQFAPYGSTGNPPSYLGLSKEPDRPKPNKAMQHLFEGLGDLFSTAVSGVDELNQQGLKKDAFEQVDKIVSGDIQTLESQLIEGSGTGSTMPKADAAEQQASISGGIFTNRVDSEGNATSGKSTASGEPVPADIDRGMNQIKRIQDAKAVKKGNSVLYEGQVHEIAQNLLSKYGIGYRSHIESALDQATNTRAAAHRKALIDAVTNLNSGKDAAQKADESWLSAHAKYFINPDGSFNQEVFRKAQQYVGTTAFGRFKEYAGEQQALEFGNKRANDALEHENKVNGVNADRAERTSSGNLDRIYSASYTSWKFSTGQGELSLAEIEQKLAGIKSSGKEPNPTELQAYGRAIAQFKQNFYNLSRSALQSQEHNTGKVDERGVPIKMSLSQMMGPERANKLLDDKMKSLDMMINDVGAGHLTLATSTATITDQMGKNDAFRLIADPTIRRVRALSEAVGPNGKAFMDAYLTAGNYKGFDEVTKALTNVQFFDFTQTKVPGGLNRVSEDYGKIKPQEAKNPNSDYLKAGINMPSKVITDPKAPLEAKINMASNLSDPGTTDFISKFHKNEQIDIWATLSQPGVAKGIKALGNEQVWQEYKTWGAQTMVRLAQTYLSNIRDGMKENPALNIRWNPETQKIDYDNVIYGQPIPGGGQRPMGLPANAHIVAINKFNLMLNTYKNILAEDGEKITPEHLKAVGLDLTPKAHESWIGNAIVDAFSPKQTTDTNTPQLFQKGDIQSDSGTGTTSSGNTQNTPGTLLPGTTPNSTSEAPTGSGGPSNRTVGPRSEVTPTPRDYGNFNPNVEIPGAMKDTVLQKLSEAGANVKDFPAAVQNKFKEAGIFSSVKLTKEDFDSISDKAWAKVAKAVGAPVPKENVTGTSSVVVNNKEFSGFSLEAPTHSQGEKKGTWPEGIMSQDKAQILAVTDQSERVANVRGYGEQLTGTITVNGNTYKFINGGGGRGSIPFSEYSITNFRTAEQRASQGMINLGDTWDLNNVSDPMAGGTRTELRIHRAAKGGTAGCIGIVGSEGTWRQFVQDMKAQGPTKVVLGPSKEDEETNSLVRKASRPR